MEIEPSDIVHASGEKMRDVSTVPFEVTPFKNLEDYQPKNFGSL